jgi:hypothetical protein
MRTLILLALLATATGCVRAYKPPSAHEPHATLKIRRVYEKRAGTNLREGLSINGHPALGDTAPVVMAAVPRADALLIHPRPARLELGAGFFHVEARMVNESYTVQVPYTTTESYSCGYGRSYSTCSRTVTHYRSETRWRTVLRNVEVSDGHCARGLVFSPQVGRAYLIDYTYRDSGICSVTCVEQMPSSAGGFESRPCAGPTPEQLSRLDD